MFFLFLSSSVFAQFADYSSYLDSYIGEEHVGLRVNPILTGLKGTQVNQEIDLNFILFYQNKYIFKKQEYLGLVEGRLISETSLSSFDPLENIRNDKSLAISNYGTQFPEYQKAIQDFILFQEAFDITIRELKSRLSNVSNLPADTKPEDKSKQQDVLPESINSTNDQLVNTQTIEGTKQDQDQESKQNDEKEDGDNVESDEQYEEYQEYEEYQDSESYEELASLLNYQPQTVLLNQMALSGESINYSGLSPLPPLPYSDPKKNSHIYLSPEEIDFVICYEKLRQNYNKAINEYNSVLSNDINSYRSSFNPADPNEKFTIMFVGNDTKRIWAKKFGLDGKKTYQSHDDNVWYLGYSIPITKKDVLALYKLFYYDRNVRYFVKGINGTATFDLASDFVSAVKELFDLYVRGGLIVDPDSEFPILGNDE